MNSGEVKIDNSHPAGLQRVISALEMVQNTISADYVITQIGEQQPTVLLEEDKASSDEEHMLADDETLDLTNYGALFANFRELVWRATTGERQLFDQDGQLTPDAMRALYESGAYIGAVMMSGEKVARRTFAYHEGELPSGQIVTIGSFAAQYERTPLAQNLWMVTMDDGVIQHVVSIYKIGNFTYYQSAIASSQEVKELGTLMEEMLDYFEGIGNLNDGQLLAQSAVVKSEDITESLALQSYLAEKYAATSYADEVSGFISKIRSSLDKQQRHLLVAKENPSIVVLSEDELNGLADNVLAWVRQER